tara:strand:- start:152 stop:853 length:702 start_codon:yes stop_codon:yes gene_type:complete
MEEKYFISYSRGSVYSDDTKDAIIIIDEEKTSENLDELISRITNNDKFLGTREEDVIDFSKELELTSFEYLIKNSNHEVVHCHSLKHEVVIKLGMMDAEVSYKKFLRQFNIEDGRELNDSNLSLYKLLIPELANSLNTQESNISHCMGDYDESYIFRCQLEHPFYSYSKFFMKLSEKYNFSVTIITLNTDVELYQSYSYGKNDEGMIDGQCNWQYLNEDYIEDSLEYLKKMNL